ncbi:glycosyltransferase family 2 protein [Acinetobacter sp.]|uniref:glycosyltransferase family 2 protein n=1 Tax=Acinetobacter sp. TaxID=472 RepID=UPI002FD9FD4B
MTIDVSIIIVNYNTYDLVLQCIESVLKHTKNITFEIIVVDNNSPNRNIEQLNLIYPQVTLVLNENNSGFGIANNIGNKVAKGQFIFLLNSDTIVIDNSIYVLYKFMVENKNAGACGGNLCDIDLQPATSFTRFMPSLLSDIDYLFFNILSKLIYGNNINYCYDKLPIKINGNISGADLMISKKLFDELGGFDENFFMYYEETDLLFRVRQKNYETFIVPKSKIIHLEGASEAVKEIKLDWTYESKKKYYLKNKTKIGLIVSDFIFYLTILQRLFVFKLIGKKEKFNYWLIFYHWFRRK